MSAIELEGLTKDYPTGFLNLRRVRALDGLSLAVERGEIFGFLGGNGAGKTTAIKILMRLMTPTAGRARILDHDAADVAVHARIGYLPEAPYFYDYLTARELLEYCAQLFGYAPAARRERVATLLRRVSLDESAWNRQLRKFSKGMLQRVGLAQALLNDPEVVVLDEPMSGLDPIGRRQVRDLIASLPAGGTTVFFSSHIIADIEVLCDRVAILSRGRLTHLGRLDDLRQTQDAAGRGGAGEGGGRPGHGDAGRRSDRRAVRARRGRCAGGGPRMWCAAGQRAAGPTVSRGPVREPGPPRPPRRLMLSRLTCGAGQT
jgi:ABC-2 type transport system ATP-binding protein